MLFKLRCCSSCDAAQVAMLFKSRCCSSCGAALLSGSHSLRDDLGEALKIFAEDKENVAIDHQPLELWNAHRPVDRQMHADCQSKHVITKLFHPHKSEHKQLDD